MQSRPSFPDNVVRILHAHLGQLVFEGHRFAIDFYADTVVEDQETTEIDLQFVDKITIITFEGFRVGVFIVNRVESFTVHRSCAFARFECVGLDDFTKLFWW